MGAVASEAGVAGSPDLGPDPLGRPRLNHAGEIAAGIRGSVVCFMAPATFLTSLGLTEAAITRTSAIVSAMAGASTSANSRTDGSPKDLNRNARTTLSTPQSLIFFKRRTGIRANTERRVQ
jgi:hypothetical protein